MQRELIETLLIIALIMLIFAALVVSHFSNMAKYYELETRIQQLEQHEPTQHEYNTELSRNSSDWNRTVDGSIRIQERDQRPRGQNRTTRTGGGN
jgi:cell division protein FtsL